MTPLATRPSAAERAKGGWGRAVPSPPTPQVRRFRPLSRKSPDVQLLRSKGRYGRSWRLPANIHDVYHINGDREAPKREQPSLREAKATKRSSVFGLWIASRSLSSGDALRGPVGSQ